MKRWHNDKDEFSENDDFDDEADFSSEGLTYNVSFDDLLSETENDEDEPLLGRSRHDARSRLRRMRDIPVAHDDSDDWDDDAW